MSLASRGSLSAASATLTPRSGPPACELLARPELQGPLARQGRGLEEFDVGVELRDVTVDHVTMVGAEAHVRTKNIVSADLAHENLSRQVVGQSRSYRGVRRPDVLTKISEWQLLRSWNERNYMVVHCRIHA